MINRNNVKCTLAWPSLVDEKLWTHAGPDSLRRVCSWRIVEMCAKSFTKPDSRLTDCYGCFYFTHSATVLEACAKHFFFFLHNLTWDIGKSGPACLLFFFVQKQTIYICRDTKHHNPFFYESKLKWTVSESFPDSPCQCWKLTLAIRLSWEQCQTFVEENLKNTSIVPSLGG